MVRTDLSCRSFNEGGCFSPGSFAVLSGVAHIYYIIVPKEEIKILY